MGYDACARASAANARQGAVDAGCGAAVEQAPGSAYAMDSGLGTAGVRLPGGVMVGALMVVNALGDVIDPAEQTVIAGTKSPEGRGFADSTALIKAAPPKAMAGTNPPIGVVATNARLTGAQVNRLASAAHNGLALTIRPCHTMLDGDTVFALSAGTVEAEFNAVMQAAVEATAMAVQNAVARHRTQA